MERDAVLEVLRTRAVELLHVQPDEVREDASLREADSLALVELVMAVEDDLGVELPEAEVAGVTSYGELADLVLAKG
jgi:acyl carrier protein